MALADLLLLGSTVVAAHPQGFDPSQEAVEQWARELGCEGSVIVAERCPARMRPICIRSCAVAEPASPASSACARGSRAVAVDRSQGLCS
jgi:hypothetical protein